jgi:hypothetical protein
MGYSQLVIVAILMNMSVLFLRLLFRFIPKYLQEYNVDTANDSPAQLLTAEKIISKPFCLKTLVEKIEATQS